MPSHYLVTMLTPSDQNAQKSQGIPLYTRTPQVFNQQYQFRSHGQKHCCTTLIQTGSNPRLYRTIDVTRAGLLNYGLVFNSEVTTAVTTQAVLDKDGATNLGIRHDTRLEWSHQKQAMAPKTYSVSYLKKGVRARNKAFKYGQPRNDMMASLRALAKHNNKHPANRYDTPAKAYRGVVNEVNFTFNPGTVPSQYVSAIIIDLSRYDDQHNPYRDLSLQRHPEFRNVQHLAAQWNVPIVILDDQCQIRLLDHYGNAIQENPPQFSMPLEPQFARPGMHPYVHMLLQRYRGDLTALLKHENLGELMEFLMANPTQVNFLEDHRYGSSLLISAIVLYGQQQYPPLPFILNLIHCTAMDINAHDKTNNTALHRAAYQGHQEIVIALLEKGADRSKMNDLGETPPMNDRYGLIARYDADKQAIPPVHATPAGLAPPMAPAPVAAPPMQPPAMPVPQPDHLLIDLYHNTYRKTYLPVVLSDVGGIGSCLINTANTPFTAPYAASVLRGGATSPDHWHSLEHYFQAQKVLLLKKLINANPMAAGYPRLPELLATLDQSYCQLRDFQNCQGIVAESNRLLSFYLGNRNDAAVPQNACLEPYLGAGSTLFFKSEFQREWEQHKYAIMEEGLYYKAKANPEVKQLLIDSAHRGLDIMMLDSQDEIWATGLDGNGLNALGDACRKVGIRLCNESHTSVPTAFVQSDFKSRQLPRSHAEITQWMNTGPLDWLRRNTGPVAAVAPQPPAALPAFPPLLAQGFFAAPPQPPAHGPAAAPWLPPQHPGYGPAH